MLGQSFYHETIRKVIVAFGTMFNDIQLVRKDSSGNYEGPACLWSKRKVFSEIER